MSNAEIGDLNADGSPEVFVYLRSLDSNQYGTIIAYSVNRNRSMSQIAFPDIRQNKKASQGYRGHDEFAIVEGSFAQRFPIYPADTALTQPTGKIRQIQYKLKEGEASRELVIDKILEF